MKYLYREFLICKSMSFRALKIIKEATVAAPGGTCVVLCKRDSKTNLAPLRLCFKTA